MTDADKIKILPCPFCGAAPKYSATEVGRLGELHSLECEKCGIPQAMSEDMDGVIKEWNRRAPAPTQPEPERDERAEFYRWHTKMAPDFRRYSHFNEHEKSIAWDAWQARAALERK